MISYAIYLFFKIIYLIIILVVLLSWIPIFNVKKEPIATLIAIYEVIMKPFKTIIPPIGMIDISPVVAFIVLQLLENFLLNTLSKFGL